MELAGVAALIAAVILLMVWRNRSSSGGGNGGDILLTLYFDRSSVPDYTVECIRRIREVVYPEYLGNLFEKGYDRRAIASIIIWETGWLSSKNAENRITHKHNILGIDLPDSPGVGRTFASYKDCVSYFEALMHNTRYGNTAYPVRGLGSEFLDALHTSGYNGNESWISGVKSIYFGAASTLPA